MGKTPILQLNKYSFFEPTALFPVQTTSQNLALHNCGQTYSITRGGVENQTLILHSAKTDVMKIIEREKMQQCASQMTIFVTN